MPTRKTSDFPALHRPDQNTDAGKVRFGDGFITDEFPTLARGDRNSDKGKIRIGDGFISGEY